MTDFGPGCVRFFDYCPNATLWLSTYAAGVAGAPRRWGAGNGLWVGSFFFRLDLQSNAFPATGSSGGRWNWMGWLGVGEGGSGGEASWFDLGSVVPAALTVVAMLGLRHLG
ncbi:unnamed protein product [Cuscuta europaea]|uniref:Uncharacterized protein n=1 Tax=Cuscuta europaea TaxID=41803 RepID=A0A9P0VQS9_CUSEU|nr:unnamed protein product [Cuscuta europaea]